MNYICKLCDKEFKTYQGYLSHYRSITKLKSEYKYLEDEKGFQHISCTTASIPGCYLKDKCPSLRKEAYL